MQLSKADIWILIPLTKFVIRIWGLTIDMVIYYSLYVFEKKDTEYPGFLYATYSV